MDQFHSACKYSLRVMRAFGIGFLFLSPFLVACVTSGMRTLSPSPTPQAEEIMLMFFESWNRAVESGELEEPLAYFAADATLETVGYYHLLSTGRAEIGTALEHWVGSGYLHAVDEYDISRDDEALYWNLEGGGEDNFCYGKIIIQDQKIIYLGYSTC